MFGNDHLITNPEHDRLAPPLLCRTAACFGSDPPTCVTGSFNCYRRSGGLVVNGCCTTVSSPNCFKMWTRAGGQETAQRGGKRSSCRRMTSDPCHSFLLSLGVRCPHALRKHGFTTVEFVKYKMSFSLCHRVNQ